MTVDEAIRIRWETIQDLKNGVSPPRHANSVELYTATHVLAAEFEKTDLAMLIRKRIEAESN